MHHLVNRSAVAREAARLLYEGLAEEYITAKDLASRNLGVKETPSNFEIAIELDQLADEIEGIERQDLLIMMRKLALEVMKKLKDYSPKLIGSVWRGTARKGSDIDIAVYSRNNERVVQSLSGYDIVEKGTVTLKGEFVVYHIIFRVGQFNVEVIVRQNDDNEERCSIYGDNRRGLNNIELERLLSVDPLRKYVPKRRLK